MRAMRKSLVTIACQGRVDGAVPIKRPRLCGVKGQSGCVVECQLDVRSTEKSRPWGSGLQQCEFAQRGWRGELLSGDRGHRSDRSGDQVKRLAVKSSTMKGSIGYERKSLPVRFRGDDAESRKSVQERYSELLLSYEEIRRPWCRRESVAYREVAHT